MTQTVSLNLQERSVVVGESQQRALLSNTIFHIYPGLNPLGFPSRLHIASVFCFAYPRIVPMIDRYQEICLAYMILT